MEYNNNIIFHKTKNNKELI